MGEQFFTSVKDVIGNNNDTSLNSKGENKEIG